MKRYLFTTSIATALLLAAVPAMARGGFGGGFGFRGAMVGRGAPMRAVAPAREAARPVQPGRSLLSQRGGDLGLGRLAVGRARSGPFARGPFDGARFGHRWRRGWIFPGAGFIGGYPYYGAAEDAGPAGVAGTDDADPTLSLGPPPLYLPPSRPVDVRPRIIYIKQLPEDRRASRMPRVIYGIHPSRAYDEVPALQ